jgi:DNA polymerase III subunit delta'
MKFSEVIGQEEAKQQLLQMVDEQRIPHALMLCGPSGSGKMALAMAFASYLLGEDSFGTEGEKILRSSLSMAPNAEIMLKKWEHPDLHFSFPTIKLANMPSEYKPMSDDFLQEWRELLSDGPYFSMNQWMNVIGADKQQAIITIGESNNLIRKLSIKSSQGGYKISIIWLPERMKDDCASKILKLIEEPPQYTLFILVSEEPERILPTILSRVQRININPIKTESITKTLIDKRGLEESTAQRIARVANGNWLKALDELDSSSENRLFLDLFTSLMRLAYMRNVKELKKWSVTVSGFGREKQKRLLSYFQRMIRENFMYNFKNPDLCYMTDEEEKFAKNFAKFINEANVIPINDKLALAQRDIGQNALATIVFFDLALSMIVLLLKK